MVLHAPFRYVVKNAIGNIVHDGLNEKYSRENCEDGYEFLTYQLVMVENCTLKKTFSTLGIHNGEKQP